MPGESPNSSFASGATPIPEIPRLPAAPMKPPFSGYLVIAIGPSCLFWHPPLLQWPPQDYFTRFQPDTRLITEALEVDTPPESSKLAHQVFGNQARLEKLNLQHLAHILYERSLLHAQHLKDMDHKIRDFQGRLSVIQMHSPLDGGKSQQHLERLIEDLEQQRRKEEIDFWKDATEIREKTLEKAAEYQAAKRRESIFTSVEG